MKKLVHLLFAFLTLLLAACGGGGGSAGTPGGSASPDNFLVNAPTALTLAVGQSASYSITGGKTPYLAVSTSPAVARASVDGGQLFIGGLAEGNAIVTVTPTGGGASHEITLVVVSSIRPLQLQAPDSITMMPGNVSDYVVSGGVPPYRLVTSNANVLRASMVSATSARLEAIGVGNANVQIYDATNAAPLVRGVTVVNSTGTSLFTTAPADLTMAPSVTRTFSVGGGLPPYSAQSSNAGVTTVSMTGNTLSISSLTDGSSQVAITDAAGVRLTFAVTVASGVPSALFTTAPASLTMAPLASRTFTIGGGVAPYSVQSSNSSAVSTSLAGSAVTVSAVTDGDATVAVTDARGTRISFTVTVSSGTPASLYTNAPASLTMSPSATRTFAVGGGVAPYTANSSNLQVVNAGVTGSSLILTTPLGAAGNAIVSVTDATGSRVDIAVTASAAAQPLALGSDNITIPVDIPARVRIIGGAAPFTVTAGIPAAMNTRVVPVVSGGITNYEVEITPLLVSSVDVVVVDASGQQAKVAVTINAATPGIRMAPIALAISENFTGQTFTLTVIGAAAGDYRVFSSDVRRISAVANVAAGTVTLTTGNATDLAVISDELVTVTVIDASDRIATSTITVKNNP